MRKATLATVAKEAGVSVPTVSQVMRGTGRISEKTRQEVLKAARKLNYVPDSRAASMRSGQSHEIGFVIHQIANPFNAEVISGVSDLLDSEGFLLSVLDARDDADRQSRHLDAFIRHARGGLLWVPAVETDAETIEMLRVHAIPTVTFLRRPPGSTFDHVGIRNTEATAAATAHLANLGHQRIAYLGGLAMTQVRKERIAGYEAVLRDRDLSAPVIWDSEDTKRAALESMTALHAAHPEVTAVVCNGDMVALGASLAIARMGLRPGDDFSIIGFDDIEDAAVATPPLTTMAVRPYQLGRRLARILLDRLGDP
ncbi:MAG: LacI family DNA-binding transcriptional regulator, partial [Pseudomonadota bacterium]